MKHFDKRNASLLHDKPPSSGTVISVGPYAHLIGAYLPARSLCALREVDWCYQQAYDQFLVETVVKEIWGQHRQDIYQLEAAVHTVAHLAEVGDGTAIAAMAAFLAHRHDRLRKAAVRALPRIVARGDPGAIAAVAELVGHAEKNVRHAALNALAEIADRGNGAATAVVVAAFEDAEAYVRSAAVSAFAQIAVKGGPAALAAVVALFKDRYTNVRCAALRTLAQIVEKGDAAAIAAVARCLGDAIGDVRLEAVSTLAKIAEKGDTAAIAEVSAHLSHWHEQVRVAAVYAFEQIAKRGIAAMDAMAPLLEDSDADVREAAVKAFPQISKKGNSAAIVALTTRLEDKHGPVRDAAGEALLQIAGESRSNVTAIRTLKTIADIKFHMIAELQITDEGGAGEEAIGSAAASVENAKLHLALGSRRLLMAAQARAGPRTQVTRSDNLSGKDGGRVCSEGRKADGSRADRRSHPSGDTRTETSFFDRFSFSRWRSHALIALPAIFWVLLIDNWVSGRMTATVVDEMYDIESVKG
jgi:HEAT repeat protein